MPPKQPVPVSPGDVVAGKYRVERIIGAGGMGVVVAARHLQLDQTVALKFMTHRTPAGDERFSREARAAARLKSEHAAKVHDVGALDNGTPYMVMEYLEGNDLHALLSAEGALPIDLAVGYVMQACEAIGEAHAHGIVHRDLKPHNLFLTTGVGGRPKIKVLDFGISKTQDDETTLTRSSDIIGTPVYMAPEQLRSSKDVDARADIWALGAMLYELVTGRLPFEADNVAHLCTMVLSEVPRPPSELRGEIPAALSDAILRCLKRDPAARFPGVDELVATLEPFAPTWAAIDRVRWVPSIVPSARVIASPPGISSGKTSAAWSETELAGPRAGKKRTSVGLAVAVAAAAAMSVIGVAALLRGGFSGTPPAKDAPVAAMPATPVATAPPVLAEATPSAPVPVVAATPDAAPVAPAKATGQRARTSSPRPASSDPRPQAPPVASALPDDAYDHR